jgi:hypothetical protein
VIHHRPTRRLLCRLFAGMLLLSQWLVAAHACAVMAPSHHQLMRQLHHPVVMTEAAEAMSPCDSMAAPCEHGPSSLCSEHCHAGQQSDQVPGASVAPALPAGAHPLPAPVLQAAHAPLVARDVPARAAAPPPHAILHCCFRI